MKLLAPIIKKIGLLEADGSSVGMVYSSFVDLLKKPVYCNPQFLNATASSILKYIEERWEFLHTDIMAIAFLLDPTKDPDDFVEGDLMKALAHVREVAARLRYTKDEQDAAFREARISVKTKWDNKLHGRALNSLSIAPLEWWGLQRKTYPALFDIARRVFMIPTSSAAAKRSWSMYKFIHHSRLRHRLLSKTMQKLLFVYYTRIGRDGIPAELYDPSTLADWSGDKEIGDDGDPINGLDAER